jgi:uncharacterized protein with NRDE domain
MSQIIFDQHDVETLHGDLFKVLFDEGDGEPFSNSFIATAEYGTCAATVLSISTRGEAKFQEQGFSNNGKREKLSTYSLEMK